MSKKHKNLVKNKHEYGAYRRELIRGGTRSYVDQFGKTYTYCDECKENHCPRRAENYGCMEGKPKKEIADKIGKNNEE